MDENVFSESELGKINHVPFNRLRLDDKNPRLAEDEENLSQCNLMRIFYRDYNLDELAESYAANGFFSSENLIALRDGTVIEGNRRLAALKYLFHDRDAADAELPLCDSLDKISPAEREVLQNSIPVLVAKDREELAAYLGFRHINGAQDWPSSSKARFVYQRVENYVNKDESQDVFKRVAREIGSNTTGTRNWYIQYALINEAREMGLQDLAAKVLLDRFGVWRRLCSNQVYVYIGFDPNAKTYEQISASLRSLDKENFSKLLEDIVPGKSQPALLADSRQTSDYTTILASPDALQTLRETRDFDIALLVAEGSPVNRYLNKAGVVLEKARGILENDAHVDEETRRIVRRLRKQLDGINGILTGMLDASDEAEC